MSSGFSGAIKLAEMNDYLTLNQSCIKPIMKRKDGTSVSAGSEAAPEPTKANTGTRVKVELEFNASDASDLRFPGLQKTGGATAALAPAVTSAPGHFDQMKLDPVKKTASVSLNDCLACSGCVTSAETVLITQQSTEEFLSVLAANTGAASVAASAAVASDAMTDVPAAAPPAKRTVIVSISPQSLMAIAHEFKLTPLSAAKRLTTFFRGLGCETLVDDTPALDMALLEAREEFVARYRYNQARLDGSASATAAAASTISLVAPSASSTHTNTISPSVASPLPILASECPGWVCYAEKTQGVETLSHVASTRSAQAIMGAILKHYWAPQHGIAPNQVYHTAVKQCYDKKLEASRDDFFIEQFATRETDCVLTTGEVVELIRSKGTGLGAIDESSLDTDYWNVTPDQSSLYRSIDTGGSGGYAEMLFRYASQRLFGVTPPEELKYAVGRNPDFREVTLEVDGKPVLTFALAYGFRNIQNIVNKMKRKRAGKVAIASEKVNLRADETDSKTAAASNETAAGAADSTSAGVTSVALPVGTGGYHFIEVMACPSGCLNGGGQVKANDIRSQKQLVVDLDTLYHQRPVCQPEDNPIVQRLYRDWLQGARPYTGLARERLHTQYHAVEKELANPLGIKW